MEITQEKNTITAITTPRIFSNLRPTELPRLRIPATLSPKLKSPGLIAILFLRLATRHRFYPYLVLRREFQFHCNSFWWLSCWSLLLGFSFFPQRLVKTFLRYSFSVDSCFFWLQNVATWFPVREFFMPPGESTSSRGLVADKRANMAFLPGRTVQCVNSRCEARGHWVKAEQLGSENCPNCGE